MNYEKIMVELLGRIQVLEEQVELLMAERDQVSAQKKDKASKIGTAEIRAYIVDLKAEARECGESEIALVSGDIHKALGLVSSMPQVCNAMRQCMNDGDEVLHTTPSGNSSTIMIKYKL